MNELVDHRIAVAVADGVDEADLAATVRALEKAGATVELVARGTGGGAGRAEAGPDEGVENVTSFAQADPTRYDAIVLPDGERYVEVLRNRADAHRFVHAFVHDNRPVAACGHAVRLLAAWDLVHNRALTGPPAFAAQLREAGARWVAAPVVREPTLLTCRGTDDRDDYLAALIPFLEARDIAADVEVFASRTPSAGESPAVNKD